jgi:hypothetical protein
MGPTLEAPMDREPHGPRVAQELHEFLRNQKSSATSTGWLLQHLRILKPDGFG